MQRFEFNDIGSVLPGESFEVSAATNQATGSRLSVRIPPGVDLVDSRSEPPRSIGGRGLTLYRFICQSPGDYKIAFVKGRPWESRQDRFHVQIRCRSV
jgi:chagasin family peptidase inhibitor I42